uniref:Heat shock transcription factor 4 n=1 Tax=Eptatretus burgeri TaxID=7764 RepID=A0A8C4R6R3_EPTBU
MDGRGGVVSPFLIKLWTLVDNQETNELIFWSANGQSFLVYDEHRFAKEILPKYFKHSKMNSFVRQLNMYGFCKVDAIRDKKDISEFEHPCFVRGSSKLLKKVKRKASIIRQKKIHWRDVGPIMKEMKRMRRTHETMNNLLYFLQLENRDLWFEVLNLQQKHAQQQKVVHKLFQFLILLAQVNHLIGLKRKLSNLWPGMATFQSSTSCT